MLFYEIDALKLEFFNMRSLNIPSHTHWLQHSRLWNHTDYLYMHALLLNPILPPLIVGTASLSYFRHIFLSNWCRNALYTVFRHCFGQFIKSDFFDAIGSSVAFFNRYAGSLPDSFPPGFTIGMQHETSIGRFFESIWSIKLNEEEKRN